MKRAATQMYYCPVCGTDLAQSDFEEPAQSYYCPFCTTRRTAQRVDPAEVRI
jgi:ribosomal protein L37AE/L43A